MPANEAVEKRFNTTLFYRDVSRGVFFDSRWFRVGERVEDVAIPSEFRRVDHPRLFRLSNYAEPSVLCMLEPGASPDVVYKVAYLHRELGNNNLDNFSLPYCNYYDAGIHWLSPKVKIVSDKELAEIICKMYAEVGIIKNAYIQALKELYNLWETT
jgi:hypothetical protein